MNKTEQYLSSLIGKNRVRSLRDKRIAEALIVTATVNAPQKGLKFTDEEFSFGSVESRNDFLFRLEQNGGTWDFVQ